MPDSSMVGRVAIELAVDFSEMTLQATVSLDFISIAQTRNSPIDVESYGYCHRCLHVRVESKVCSTLNVLTMDVSGPVLRVTGVEV